MLGVILVAATAWAGHPELTKPRWLPPAGLFGGRVPLPREQTASPAPTQPPHAGSRGVSGLLVLAIAAVVAAIILFFLLRYLRGRPTHLRLPAMSSEEELLATPSAAAVEQEPDAPTVHRGLRAALDALDAEREPADAVVKAWLGLQSAAEDSGVERRGAETPTEFTARVITRVHADSGAATALVDVYQAVRFGGHAITALEVNAARAAVNKLLASWHDPALGLRR